MGQARGEQGVEFITIDAASDSDDLAALVTIGREVHVDDLGAAPYNLQRRS